ncbi:IMPACT family protein [Halopseudomonas salegens]|uniref:Uncharacterized protein, YigZ family n=1 Tax=Halopseudomonas salegens TaxID=1434072 RepID=A0A1H2H4H0_9GAMM|nr:YigZ family protein [Halopseudomonas salegens]SDU26629.1 uncharacterized protein, YigZ family [Halopseudomonas salegens]
MYGLTHPVSCTLEIRKSRFIGCVEPVSDRAAAQQRVAELRAQHPDAAHVCWALLAGGHSAAVDDGEPSGTAGRPMLEVLRHQQLDGVLATVVRYFGGTKLGAGGLVRAYTEAIAQALQQADLIPVQRMRTLHCQLPFAQESTARRLLDQLGGELLTVSHSDGVQLDVRLEEKAAEDFLQQLQTTCRGDVSWQDAVDED